MTKMLDWISLVLVFAFGIVVGILISSFLFESRLKFYKEFIEHRLAAINLHRFQGAAKHRSPKSSHEKTLSGRASNRGENSKSSQN